MLARPSVQRIQLRLNLALSYIMPIRIQIISLNPQSDDVQNLIRNISNQGLTPEIFNAVDGRTNFPSLQENETLDQAQSLKRRFIPLTKTEVACYLSHLRAIRQAYNDGVERFCLLEDDISIEANFSTVLKELLELPEEYELIRLMGLKRHPYKVVKTLQDGTQFTCPVKGLCGGQGYIVSRAGGTKGHQ